jgi:hypothetical protein
MARGWDDQDIPSLRDRKGPIEATESLSKERDGGRIKPERPSMREEPLKPALDSRGSLMISSGHEDLCFGKVVEASGMVGMQMGEDDRSYLRGIEAQPT